MAATTAAALTYYLILALFGIFGAESAVDDAAEELARRGFDEQYVNAVRETIESAVTQRSGEAWIVVAISVVAALYVASQWVRGVGRGLDAALERPHASAGLGRQLRDALALVLLFSGAVLLQFGGSRIATGVFGEGFPLLQIAATIGFRMFAERWPDYDTNYGVFATLIVGLIWLWLTNVAVLLGGAFAHEWANAASPVPAHAERR